MRTARRSRRSRFAGSAYLSSIIDLQFIDRFTWDIILWTKVCVLWCVKFTKNSRWPCWSRDTLLYCSKAPKSRILKSHTSKNWRAGRGLFLHLAVKGNRWIYSISWLKWSLNQWKLVCYIILNRCSFNLLLLWNCIIWWMIRQVCRLRAESTYVREIPGMTRARLADYSLKISWSTSRAAACSRITTGRHVSLRNGKSLPSHTYYAVVNPIELESVMGV